MTLSGGDRGPRIRRAGSAACVSVLLAAPLACSRGGADGAYASGRPGATSPPAGATTSVPATPGSPGGGAAAGQPFTVVAAGDIATKCSPTSRRCGHRLTADRVAAIDPAYVVTLGDNQYDKGTLREYRAHYDHTWGRFRSRTYPVPGNHEYAGSASAAGYRAYFGARATPSGRTWYSWNHGGWHFVALDSDLPMSAGSAQLRWLKADLAANRRRCVAAYWHHPRFSSGRHGSDPVSDAAWRALYRARADLVLSGHDHSYERYAPQNPSGEADAAGIRQITVGTGGASAYGFKTRKAGSVRRMTGVFAVLALALADGRYSGRLIRADGAVLDSFGPLPCH